MKFRRNKIKREHSIIQGALDWLEDLSKIKDVTDIIPGVIDVTHSRERGVFFQYDTGSGCKLLVKNGGSIQEVFVVTPKPQAVRDWVEKIMGELDLIQSALDSQLPPEEKAADREGSRTANLKGKQAGKQAKSPKALSRSFAKEADEQPNQGLMSRHPLLQGIQEEYRLVEINPRLRDSYVESLASMADLEPSTLEDRLDPATRAALKNIRNARQNKKTE